MDSPICAEQGMAKAMRAMTMIFSLRDCRLRAVIVAMVLQPKPSTSGMTALPVMPIFSDTRRVRMARLGRYPMSSRSPKTRKKTERMGRTVVRELKRPRVRRPCGPIRRSLQKPPGRSCAPRPTTGSVMRRGEEQRERARHVDHHEVDDAEEEGQDGQPVHGVAAQRAKVSREARPRLPRRRLTVTRAAISSTHCVRRALTRSGALPARLRARISSSGRLRGTGRVPQDAGAVTERGIVFQEQERGRARAKGSDGGSRPLTRAIGGLERLAVVQRPRGASGSPQDAPELRDALPGLGR